MMLVQVVTYDDLLVGLATRVLLGCAAWAALIVTAAVVEAASRGRVRATWWVGTPPGLRRALLAGLGVLLAGAAPGPVSAAVALGSTHRPHPLPVPARPVGSVAPHLVTVRSGDTLWSLAGRRLRPGAGDRQVLAAVHRWYARNTRVIGPDPDLIRPGQQLRPPTAEENQ